MIDNRIASSPHRSNAGSIRGGAGLLMGWGICGSLIWAAVAAGHEPFEADTLRATLEVRLGGGMVSEVMFERIEAVETNADGGIFVLDGTAHTLRAFDARGSERWSVGREGRGPGEFAAPVGLTWAPDGTLWVIDPENQRATAVAPDGRMTAEHRLPAGFALSPWPGRFGRDGRFYSYVDAPDGSYDFQIAVYDRDLVRTATLTPPRATEPTRFFEGVTERGSHVRTRVPYTPRLVWRLDSGGRFVSAWTAEMAFTGPDGRRVVPDGDWRAPPVSRAERAAAIQGLARFVRLGGRVDERELPDRKPVLATFVPDDGDRIWALRSREPEARESVFEVFTAGGEHLRTVVVPAVVATFPTPAVRSGWMVAVERDELGVESVLLFGVETGTAR